MVEDFGSCSESKLNIDEITKQLLQKCGIAYFVIDDKGKKLHSIIISQNFFKENVSVLVIFGAKLSDYTKWQVKSIIVESDEKPNRVIFHPICDFADSEIKGYVVTNENSEIRDFMFARIIEQIPLIMEINQGNKVFVEKYIIGESEIAYDPIPFKAEWFREQDTTIKNYLDSLVKKHSSFRRLRIIEPYISIDLIKLLDMLPIATEVQIITKQKSSGDSWTDIETEFKRLTKYKVTLKQLTKSTQSPNINQGFGQIFHDRFFIGDFGGFYIGTSINSIFRNGTIITEFSGGKELMDHFDNWFSGTIINVNSADYCCKEIYSHERTDFT